MSPNISSACEPARTRLVDAIMDRYLTWREESAAVAALYERWARAPREDRADAFAAYLVGLEYEEHAASAYRSLVERAAARDGEPLARS